MRDCASSSLGQMPKALCMRGFVSCHDGNAGVQSRDACHLFGRDDTKLAWLNTLVHKFSGSIASALTTSKIDVLKVTHFVQATRCNPAQKINVDLDSATGLFVVKTRGETSNRAVPFKGCVCGTGPMITPTHASSSLMTHHRHICESRFVDRARQPKAALCALSGPTEVLTVKSLQPIVQI